MPGYTPSLRYSPMKVAAVTPAHRRVIDTGERFGCSAPTIHRSREDPPMRGGLPVFAATCSAARHQRDSTVDRRSRPAGLVTAARDREHPGQGSSTTPRCLASPVLDDEGTAGSEPPGAIVIFTNSAGAAHCSSGGDTRHPPTGNYPAGYHTGRRLLKTTVHLGHKRDDVRHLASGDVRRNAWQHQALPVQVITAPCGRLRSHATNFGIRLIPGSRSFGTD